MIAILRLADELDARTSYRHIVMKQRKSLQTPLFGFGGGEK
jgi:hypothetical protein